MRYFFLMLTCLLFLGNQTGMTGHRARPTTESGGGGIGIDTINTVSPDFAHNFTIESSDSSITITRVPNGIDLSIPLSVETINTISPDSDGNFEIDAGMGVVITPGVNSLTISAPGGGSGVGAIAGDTGDPFITGTPVTISGGSTGLLTDAVSSTEINLTGTLSIGHGGTSVTSVTISPTASAFAGWDANANLSARGFVSGYTTTATSGSTTTLTVSSTQQQYFTGSSTQTLTLPVTSTLALGQTFNIVNNSTGIVTVQSSSGGIVEALSSGTSLLVSVISTSDTTAAGWNAQYDTEAPNGTSRFVVDIGGRTGYSTIQSAINAAAAVATSDAPQTVWIWPGQYVENLTLQPYVSLAGATSGGAFILTGVIIQGTTTYTPANSGETLTLSNVTFQTPFGGGDAFTLAGNNFCKLIFTRCAFRGSFGNCLTSTNTSFSTDILQYDCISIADSGFSIYSIEQNNLAVYSCVNTSTDTNSSINGGQLFVNACNYTDCFTVTSGTLYVNNSVGVAFTNTPLFTVGSAGILYCFNSTFSTSATYWASGTGHLFYNVVTASLNASAQVNPTLIQVTKETLQVGNISFDNGVSTFDPTTLTANQVLLGNAPDSSLSVVTAGTSGQVLTSNGSSAPTWQDITWNSNNNISANSFIAGYTTTATSGSTTTLTVTSTQQQYFTGGSTQTVALPVTSTLSLGQTFKIVNNSTGVVTVQSSSGDTVEAISSGTILYVTAISTSDTTPAGWSAQYATEVPNGAARFVVDVGGRTGYSTIQSAIDAAAAVATDVAPQTVWIWDGRYVENLTLQPYVSLAGASSGGAFIPIGVVIEGNATYTPANNGETLSISNVTFQTPGGGGDAFTLAGNNFCKLIFTRCAFRGSFGNCLTSTNTSFSTDILQYDCISIADSGFSIYSIEQNNLGVYSCVNTSVDTNSSIDGGQLFINACNYTDCFTIMSGTLYVNNSAGIAFTGTPLFTIESSGALYCFNSTFSTSATYWATGTGHIFYNAVSASLGGSAQVNPTLNDSTKETLQVGNVSFDGGVSTFDPTTLTANRVLLGNAPNSSLSVVSAGTLGQVLTAQTSAAPIWANAGSMLSVTPVSYLATPYSVLSTDYYLECDVSGGALTILLPASPTTGQAFVIKDASGNANNNNITITTSGGPNIDGSASYLLDHRYQSANILFGTSIYQVYSGFAGAP